MADMKGPAALKILNTAAFVFLVIINILANLLPINGVTTGEVSEAYPNLFTPASCTFSIWGGIYFLLALFVLYQFGVFNGSENTRDDYIMEIGYLFAATSLANVAWLFAWHYRMIFLSVLLLLALLAGLAVIGSRLDKKEFSGKEWIFVKLPFSLYFGWVTVAAIANVIVWLVSIGFTGFSNQTWTAIAMVLALVAGVCGVVNRKNIGYGLAVLWAFAGIFMKHISPDGFNGQYHVVIVVAVFSMIVLVLSILFLSAANRKHPIKL
ncbi:tryptophan-rich sensory protein [Caproiciproducens galactitolivorans]|nr:tryptophan-rich sensory protein [Caproiciproducens galactitolivorans]